MKMHVYCFLSSHIVDEISAYKIGAHQRKKGSGEGQEKKIKEKEEVGEWGQRSTL